MFKVWFKIFKDTHLLCDTVIENGNPDMTRTKKVFDSLEKACHEFNLANPIWLNSTINDFKRHDKARFYKDNFVEEIDFDYLEMQVLEED